MPRAITAPFDSDVDLDLGSFLLRRRGAVAVAPGDLLPGADPWSTRGLVALDADLARRGYLLTSELRSALARLSPSRLAETGDGLLARIDHLLGADREHVPLFRRFPDAVPDHAQLFFTRQIRAFLLNQPRQPCAHCGRRGAEAGIGALAPCAHLLCAGCLDGLTAEGRGEWCPTCGTPLGAGTYLSEDNRIGRKAAEEFGGERALRPLRLITADQVTAAMGEFDRLLARRTPLSPQDRDDLTALLAHAPQDLPERLPAQIPLRETKATVLAALLRRGGADALPFLAERIDTATDVLRLLWAWSGAEPDLLPATARRLRLKGLPRPVRRGLLDIMEGLDPTALVEDLRRHRSAWLRAGELLHPYEHRRRIPNVTTAFVVLRGTDLRTHEVGREHAEPPAGPLRVVSAGEHTRLGFTGFAARVEALLAAGDTEGALRALAGRPGELVRRLHHVLRVHATTAPGTPLSPSALNTVAAALTRVAPGPLLGAYGALRGTRTAGERRLYFPGRTTAPWCPPDSRSRSWSRSRRSCCAGAAPTASATRWRCSTRGWANWSHRSPSAPPPRPWCASRAAVASGCRRGSGCGCSCTGCSRRSCGSTWTCRWRSTTSGGTSPACATTPTWCTATGPQCTRATTCPRRRRTGRRSSSTWISRGWSRADRGTR
ncbi:hypothetical protein [Streptomyces sp. NRRL S-495]|uniref:hypothetical protein n=1 Tax=Streptomyces sp. NRRL S-495 TaxID=1609133 RepID=UPI000697B61B|nr:hypothetical protein [Streptomyces sp. NRRL S-495]